MNLLWAGMIVGEWYIASLSFRKLRKSYPMFTALVCFMAVKSIVLFYIANTMSDQAYFYPYYYSDLVVCFLQLSATIEVFGTMFRPFWTVPRQSLITLSLFTVVGASLIAKASTVFQAHHANGDMAYFRSIDRLTSCSIALVLGAVLLFSNYFEMPYRSRLKGIASGLFLMSVSGVVSNFLISRFATSLQIHLYFLPVGAHYLTLAIWCYYIERKESLVAVVGRNDLGEIQRMLDQFRFAVSYAPISSGLTQGKDMDQSVSGEQKAKVVNH